MNFFLKVKIVIRKNCIWIQNHRSKMNRIIILNYGTVKIIYFFRLMKQTMYSVLIFNSFDGKIERSHYSYFSPKTCTMRMCVCERLLTWRARIPIFWDNKSWKHNISEKSSVIQSWKHHISEKSSVIQSWKHHISEKSSVIQSDQILGTNLFNPQ